jgi:hypothetical protein
MITALALALTCLTAYGIVEAALWLVGPSPVLRAVVFTTFTLNGFVLPWFLLTELAEALADLRRNRA